MNNREVERGLFAASGFYLLAAAGLVLFAFAVGAIEQVMTGIFPGITQEWLTLAVNVLYYGLLMFMPCALWASRRSEGADCLRLNPLSLGATVRTVIIALLCVMGMYDLTAVWTAVCEALGLNVFVDVYIRPANTAELTRSIISTAVIAAVSEELLFRGVMMNAWENRGAKQGILVPALLFALLHGSITGFPAEILCGIVLAVIVKWTNSLYAGMIYHTTYNAALVLLNYVATAPAAEETAAENMTMFELIGGAAGAAGLLLDVLFTAMIIWVLLQKFRFLYMFRNRAVKAFDRAIMERALQRRRQAELSGENVPPADYPADIDLTNDDPVPGVASAPMVCTEPLSAGIVILIIAGVLTTLVLYAVDIMSMLG